MNIINLKLINDYINGKKISEKKLEKLENNRDFMIDVMNISNDYRTYKLCSEHLKKDYEFVLFYVNKFKDNIEAIDKAATYFIEHSKNQIKNFELYIIMKNLTNECDKICIKYGINAEAISLDDEGIISTVRREINDPAIQNLYGLGFCYLNDKYSTSETILDHYATRLIRNLFDNNRKKLEIEIHTTFENPDQIKEYGINNYLIDYISRYDQELSSYVQNRLHLLTPLKDGLISISLKWGIYNNKINDLRYRKIMKIYDKYMGLYKQHSSIDYYDLLKYIVKILDISDEIFEYKDDNIEDNWSIENYTLNSPTISKDTSNSNEKFYELVDVINEIMHENDPSRIRLINLQTNECKVTKIRDRHAEITQL